jgi:hypothetical protein
MSSKKRLAKEIAAGKSATVSPQPIHRILTIKEFDQQAKRLGKKYPSFKADLALLVSSLLQQPEQGYALGKGAYKVRMAISSKGKGKSGGARVITFVLRHEGTLFLLNVYDKSVQADLAQGRLDELTQLALSFLEPSSPAN